MPPTSRLYDALNDYLSQCQIVWRDARLFGSRGTIKSRPSHLDLDVPVSVHPAPDILGSCLAFASHVDVVRTAFMNNNKVVIFQV